ncbi:MAG: Hsp20/alpha crystallin family protein [Aquabacterium sp.]|jgi:HSP20 family protein|uniref:Hsp20/alpha crystallin family protein n=1 Tax=Aquabacterium sp. TaxID=1872578 RepID=UPI003BAE1FB6
MASQFPIPFVGPRELRRFDPFDDLTQEMSRLFGNFFPGAGSLMGLPARAADLVSLPRLDVQEDEAEIRVFAELPGVDAADVDVRVDDDVLTISGEKKALAAGHTSSYHVMERSFGQFRRAIALPFSPEPQAVEAHFDLGVLTVRLPKPVQAARSGRIAVRQGAPAELDPGRAKAYLHDQQRMPAGPESELKMGDEPAH